MSISIQAQVGNWLDIPTPTEIRKILALPQKLVLATDGGLLEFNEGSEHFSNGYLNQQTHNLDINTLMMGSDSLLFIGSRAPGPIVEVLDLSTAAMLPIDYVDLDEVTSFLQVGDSIYATYRESVNGGLLVYRQVENRVEYLDQLSNFPDQENLELGDCNNLTRVGDHLVFRSFGDLLWADLGSQNLKDPDNWIKLSLPSSVNQINDLLANDSTLLIAADNAIYEYDFNTLVELYSGGSDILKMKPRSDGADEFYLLRASGIQLINLTSNSVTDVVTSSGLQSLELDGAELWFSSNQQFLNKYSNGDHVFYSANRPRTHLFNKLIYPENGILTGGAKGGLSFRDPQGWRSIYFSSTSSGFNESTWDWSREITDTLAYPRLRNVIVEDIVEDQLGNLYFSMQGRGVLRLGQDTTLFNAENNVLESTFDSEDSLYILAGQLAVDSQNTVWITTKLIRSGGNSVTGIQEDGSVVHIPHQSAGLTSRTIKCVAVDANDNLWLGSQIWTEPHDIGGLHFVDGSSISSDVSEIRVSRLSGTPPLASNDILQLEVDAENVLWILTTAGLQSMRLPNTWMETAELRNWAQINMSSSTFDDYGRYLGDYNISSIEIDPRGNRWFLSANLGVHALQANGRWLNSGYGYNTGNSDILDNEILSMAFNAASGEAYFSTPKGISVLKTPFANPKADYSTLYIFPQPFSPGLHDKVIIQGLMDHSSVKILTISGALVRELSSQTGEVQGFEAQWDGRDTAGDFVGNGVYLLYFFNEDGQASNSKIAVLR